ncbi:MAG: hypothetical protein HY519_03370 [Candidatus Aenigmarchaeota archaeon]|nr:hypothetical protein [Candidatus Aenigmarchaeota archaeon]
MANYSRQPFDVIFPDTKDIRRELRCKMVQVLYFPESDTFWIDPTGGYGGGELCGHEKWVARQYLRTEQQEQQYQDRLDGVRSAQPADLIAD